MSEGGKMKIEYDKEADALYIQFQKKKVALTKEIEEGINVDLDRDGKVIGIEIIGVSERYKLKDFFDIKTNLSLKKTA